MILATPMWLAKGVVRFWGSHQDSSDREQGLLCPVSWEKAAGNFLEYKCCSRMRILPFPPGSSKAMFVLSHSTGTGRFPLIVIRGKKWRPASPFFIPGKPGRREENDQWMMELHPRAAAVPKQMQHLPVSPAGRGCSEKPHEHPGDEENSLQSLAKCSSGTRHFHEVTVGVPPKSGSFTTRN